MAQVTVTHWCFRVANVVAAFLLTGAPSAAIPPERPCSGGWLNIQATIARMDPADAKAKVRGANEKLREVKTDSVVCSGETLLVPPGVTVVLYEAGQNRVITGGSGAQSQYVEGRAEAVVQTVARYLESALNAVTSVRTPAPEAKPTMTRGGSDEHAAPLESLRPIRLLRGLGTQKLTSASVTPLGWRGGVAPYSCKVLGADGTEAWTSQLLLGSRCEATADKAGHLRVEDANGKSLDWNYETVESSTVPRPEWIAAGNPDLSAAERTAWGIWLWRNGGPAWRLQSLGMLAVAARSQWLARSFIDNAMNEAPMVVPQ